MTIFDRYLLRFFVKVLVVLFVSVAGLTIIIDLVTNFTEFHEYGQQTGSIWQVLGEYYGVRVLAFFDRTSALFCLVAATFTIAWLQRTHEMTAVLAAGISNQRVARPLLTASLVVALLAVANRELLIPDFRDKLSRNAQNWLGQRPSPLKPRYDQKNHLLISGLNVIAAERRLVKPMLRLHAKIGDFGSRIAAESAVYREAAADRPAGYLFEQVTQPTNLASLASGMLEGRPVLLSPRDTTWLEADQCFLVTGVEFKYLSAGTSWVDHSSTAQLIGSLRNPSIEYGSDVRVAIHRRFVQPVVDLTLVFLGLPLVLSRPSRNVFAVVGLCLLVVMAFFLVTLTCQALGASGYLLSPALAAWFPLFLFLPLAMGMNRSVAPPNGIAQLPGS